MFTADGLHAQITDEMLESMMFQPYSWGCLSIENPVRLACIRIACHPVFEKSVMAIIILNCITLALLDPLDDGELSFRSRIVKQSEPVFTALFTMEMMVKVRAWLQTAR